mgnify:CR=1 FL=1
MLLLVPDHTLLTSREILDHIAAVCGDTAKDKRVTILRGSGSPAYTISLNLRDAATKAAGFTAGKMKHAPALDGNDWRGPDRLIWLTHAYFGIEIEGQVLVAIMSRTAIEEVVAWLAFERGLSPAYAPIIRGDDPNWAFAVLFGSTRVAMFKRS